MFNKNLDKLENNYLGLRMSDGAGIYLIAFVFLYIAQIAVIAIASMTNANKEGLTINYIVMAVNQIVFFMAPLLYGKIFARQMIEPSKIKVGLNFKQICLIAGISVACIVAFLPLSNAFSELMKLTGYSYDPGLPLADPNRWWTIITSLIFVAVLPAIGEEFLFRGSIARSFKNKGYVFSMVMTSLFFSTFHGNAVQLVHQFFLGLVLAFTYFVTGSLLSAMIIHFLNNAIAIFIIFVEGLIVKGGGVIYQPSLEVNIAINIAMFVVGVLALLILLRTLIREGKKRKGMEVDKVSIKPFFKDIAKAFYPKGIKSNVKRLNAVMKELYDDPTDRIVEEVKPINEHLEVENLDFRRQLVEADKEMEKKRKRIDRNAIMIALGITMLVWIINLIGVYIK